MIWWISGGVVAVALLILVAAAAGLLGSVRRFVAAQRILNARVRAGQQRFEPKLAALQEKAEALQTPLQAAQDRSMLIQARRGELSD